MIRHTVVFTLKHPQYSLEEKRFLSDAKRILSAIKGVTHFEPLRQVSPKNDYHFGFSMEFVDQAPTPDITSIPTTLPSCATAGSRKSKPSWKSTMCR